MKILQILVLMFGLAFLVNAQEKITLLSGTVYDADKTVVPLTAITATDSNKFVFKTISDERGFYKIWLPTGKYTIDFHKYGFKRLIITDFEDLKRNGKTINVNLEIGYCSDCNGDPFSDEIENIRKPNEVDFSKPKEKTGILKGSFVDEYGTVLSGLFVSFKNNKEEEFQVLTNENGEYSVRLPFGTYKISAQFKSNFKNKKLKIKINKTEIQKPKIVLFNSIAEKTKT
jgi:Carboxypeptidase regulatory-like domain